MSRIRIENNGHIVEIESGLTELEPIAKLARGLWEDTVDTTPRMSVGFGSQLVERAEDKPVQGNGAYELKPEPHTARCTCNTPPPTVVGEGKDRVATRPPGWRCPRHGQVI